jgi:vitamin B12 transporter
MYVLPGGEQTVRKWAVYANDTILLNRLSVTPGIRLDHTSSNGDVTSPSLGLTSTLGKNTIIRASAAHGFSIPKTGDTFGAVGGWVGNPDLKMETVWSYQAGVESAALKYVWMKFSMFRNDIRNEIGSVTLVPSGEIQNQNIGRGRREGVVIEAKTAPVFGTTLSAGAEFVTAKDLNTGEHIIGVPVQVYDMGVTYDDKDSFKAQLQGRHINWNAGAESKYHSMLLDLTMIKKVHQHKDSLVEVFVSAHNLLNTTQYLVALYPNPERWFEGGVRYKF